ncbi:LysR substrate-binding domain-containing protein [Glaciimonas sp. Gout2]|uniref:LysR substrate-binding domain-containing protein n=2 Tax=Glaciimonas TaxID=1229970 RepID=UPI002AB47E51|nr:MULTISPECIES: LysR substrate-binding domain-containing protein [unclassified Glaciimonas]MDY7548019.1 LysR substrate-binding domain-containing protein [Glaciimonas sp. CA11.2]MEB0010189.1 LysR substrate-binding domain-containing protein [Glaciimonas sp. Cout2]MEB0084306.1 LysR substrate-binding domain-containing protein [Glaciimonas sp. Gout2]
MAIHFDLVDLRLFVYIAEENSLTRAAVRAHLSLPAASIRIKNLEQSIGTKLLNRENHGVTLRPPGQALLHHARQVLNQLENLRGDLQEYAHGIKGHVRILANTTAMTEFLPNVLSHFLSTRPDINIDLRERLSSDIVRAVSEGTTDIGIVAGTVRTEGLHVTPYRSDRLVLVTGPDHILAQNGPVSFADTLEYDFIGLHEGSAIHSFLANVASELRVTLRLRIQVSGFETVCRMAEANIGIAILPESAARRYSRHMAIKITRLSDLWAIRNLVTCVQDPEMLPTFARELMTCLELDRDEHLAFDRA